MWEFERRLHKIHKLRNDIVISIIGVIRQNEHIIVISLQVIIHFEGNMSEITFSKHC